MTTPRPGPVLLRPAEDGGPEIGDWFCLTVVRPEPDPLTDPLLGARTRAAAREATAAHVSAAVARLGADPAALVPWDRDPARFDDLDGADGGPLLVSVVPGPGAVPPAVVLLEVGGCEGARPDVLRALSTGARVHCLFVGVQRDTVAVAVNGRLLVRFDAETPWARDGETPDALGPATAALEAAARAGDVDAVDVELAQLFADLTGVPFDLAWWRGEQLLGHVVPTPEAEPAAPPDLPVPVRALGERAAADPSGRDADVLLATLQDAARAALHLTGLVDDPDLGPPLAQAVAEAGLLRRRALDADPELLALSTAAHTRISGTVATLWETYRAPDGPGRPDAPARREDDPAWQRFQASLAVTELLAWAVGPAGPHAGRSAPDDVLLHVRFALGDRWDAFEDALVAHVHETAGP